MPRCRASVHATFFARRREEGAVAAIAVDGTMSGEAFTSVEQSLAGPARLYCLEIVLLRGVLLDELAVRVAGVAGAVHAVGTSVS